MKYNTTIVTPPIRTDETFEIPIDGMGDTLFISVDHEYHKELNLPDVETPKKLRFPYVSLGCVSTLDLPNPQDKQIQSVGVMGEDLIVTVNISEVQSQDITVDYTIAANNFSEMTIRANDRLNRLENNRTYAEFFDVLDTTGLSQTTGTVTIVAGSLSGSDTITTTANTDMLRGKGSFYSASVVLSNISTPSILIHEDFTSGNILLEDALVYPQWGDAAVEVWGKLPFVSYFQPITDPATSATVTFTFGFDEVDDGSGVMVLSDTILRGQIVDDIPLDVIQLRPVTGTIPIDVESETPVDLSTNLPFYKCCVTLGRR